MDESSSLGFGPVHRVWGHSVGWKKSVFVVVVVVVLFCFVSFCFLTSGVPPNEGFQSRALGRGDWTTRNLLKNWGLGTCQAHYDI